MFANFRKAFFSTKEEKETQAKWLEDNPLPKKENINLIKTHDGIYVSEPLQGFEGECEGCKNFIKNYPYYIEGGWCKLHKCSCGWGFTCDDFKDKP